MGLLSAVGRADYCLADPAFPHEPAYEGDGGADRECEDDCPYREMAADEDPCQYDEEVP